MSVQIIVPSGRSIADADIPSTIARDSEVTSAISTHAGESDPHTGYQKESEKDQANGYAGLNGSTLVPVAKLGSGSPDATKFLRGDGAWAGTGDLAAHFRHAGTSPFETWYLAAIENASTIGAGGTAPTADVLYAFPYFSGRGGTIDRLAFEITAAGGANSKMRLGVYQATSITNLYPNNLLVDGGEIATNSGSIKTATIDTDLPVNVLLWVCLLATGGGGGVASIRVIPGATGCSTVLGYISTFGGSTAARYGIGVAQTYGALPDPFTAGAAFNTAPYTSNIPVLGLRYSA